MDALLDIFDLFNMLDKAEGALAGLLNFERGTHGKRLQKRGMVTLFLPRELGKSGAEAEQYLKRFGIPVHGGVCARTVFASSYPVSRRSGHGCCWSDGRHHNSRRRGRIACDAMLGESAGD